MIILLRRRTTQKMDDRSKIIVVTPPIASTIIAVLLELLWDELICIDVDVDDNAAVEVVDPVFCFGAVVELVLDWTPDQLENTTLSRSSQLPLVFVLLIVNVCCCVPSPPA